MCDCWGIIWVSGRRRSPPHTPSRYFLKIVLSHHSSSCVRRRVTCSLYFHSPRERNAECAPGSVVFFSSQAILAAGVVAPYIAVPACDAQLPIVAAVVFCSVAVRVGFSQARIRIRRVSDSLERAPSPPRGRRPANFPGARTVWNLDSAGLFLVRKVPLVG